MQNKANVVSSWRPETSNSNGSSSTFFTGNEDVEKVLFYFENVAMRSISDNKKATKI